ncbi:Kinesin-like protein NACK1 [Acorus calamus]|uniref:Kinesin-like protein NACK1 n=1 Tax=Acorus calamus TaxID=4465 RepID=A0AAV9DPS1_ACOCL|nr:Kinesin-like protein NACK1 [Acorus calamus]
MTIKTPSTPASKIERTPMSTPGGPKVEEKIFVTVRLRPLSKKEQMLKDQVAWEYKVFGPACLTEMVYEDGAKDTPERNFVIRISALEIYNEIVKDLLNSESAPLCLLDDPERQVGETALNDTSSRSHQINRLKIESSLWDYSGCIKSFIASLNFVDLAGSERASQTHADGARLKEGCHINRSLLTTTN